jgi:hypothetical protein
MMECLMSQVPHSDNGYGMKRGYDSSNILGAAAVAGAMAGAAVKKAYQGMGGNTFPYGMPGYAMPGMGPMGAMPGMGGYGMGMMGMVSGAGGAHCCCCRVAGTALPMAFHAPALHTEKPVVVPLECICGQCRARN